MIIILYEATHRLQQFSFLNAFRMEFEIIQVSGNMGTLTRCCCVLHSGPASANKCLIMIQNHPLACAASLAVLNVIEQENLLQNIQKQGAFLGIVLSLGHDYFVDFPFQNVY